MDNTLEQIKMLNLTDEDFKLLVDGLDCLPEKGMAGEMLGDLLIGMIVKDDDEAKKKALYERDEKRRQSEKNKELMRENIKILQGKLLMLKRYMEENKLLTEAYEVINFQKH